MGTNSIKLKDLVMTSLNENELSNIKGGIDVIQQDGCQTGICSEKINPDYCSGGAVCTSGIK